MKKAVLLSTLAWLVFFSLSCGTKKGWQLAARRAGFPPKEAPARLVVYRNKLWNISRSGGVWSSDDGVSWVKTCAQVAGNLGYIDDAFAYHDQIWVIGHLLLGAPNRFFHSTDGVTWTELTPEFLPHGDYREVLFNNQVWLMYTVGSTFCSSSDLLNWTQDGPILGNDNRFSLSGGSNPLVFQGQLWRALGRGRNMEVWKSDDGHAWVQVPGNFPPPIRWAYCFTKYKDELWLIGGQDSRQPDQFYNDAWFSKDGSHWTQTTPGFSPRCGMPGVEFNGSLWVIGGDTRANLFELVARLPYYFLQCVIPPFFTKPELSKTTTNTNIWRYTD